MNHDIWYMTLSSPPEHGRCLRTRAPMGSTPPQERGNPNGKHPLPPDRTIFGMLVTLAVSPKLSGVENPSARDVVTPPRFPLPSGEFTMEAHFDVLRRFMSASRNGVEPVDATAVEGNGVPLGAARANCAFLCGIGLLVEEKPGQFKPTAVAMQFINTQLGDDSRGRRLLKSLIEKSWFGTAAKAVVRADSPKSSQEEDLRSALAGAARIPPGEREGELRVLVEYLTYTRIYIPAAPVSSGSRNEAASAASTPRRAVTAAPLAPPEPTQQSGRQAVAPANENPDWEVVQTSEFHLRIEPKAAAVRRLRKQLDLLEQKLNEQVESRPQ
jgi:hypothetical protein